MGDSEERIQSLLPLIDSAIGEGVAIVVRVEGRFYGSGEATAEQCGFKERSTSSGRR